MRPLFDKIIVVRDKPAAQTAEGIHLAPDAQRPTSTGTITAVGEGRLCLENGVYFRPELERHACHVEPLRVKVGDRVLFGTMAGSEIEVDDPANPRAKLKVLIMSEDEVLSIL